MNYSPGEENKSFTRDGVQISVIIPTHNRPDCLAKTVMALRCQTLPTTDYEILVMDDGATLPISLENEMEKPPCRLIRLQKMERSAARNTGASLACGQILVFLDDDIGVKEDFLALHLQAQAEWPHALIVGAIDLPDETLNTPFGRFRRRLEKSGMPQTRGVVAQPNFCTAANLSVDRNLYFELGGFNDKLKSGEDQELALRHTARGGQIVFLPEADVIHYDHALDIQSYCRRVQWGSENVLLFCLLRPDWPDNRERHRHNGFLQLEKDSFSLSWRKILKAVFGQQDLLRGLFSFTAWFERTRPESSLLPRLYQFLLGIHLQKGYRTGLRKLEAQRQAWPYPVIARRNV